MTYDIAEQELLQKLREIGSRQYAFEVTLKGYSHFKTHTIYVDILNKFPFNELARMLKAKVYDSMKSHGGDKPFIGNSAHLTIARRLEQWQFEKAWKEYADKKISEKFNADGMYLIKKPAIEKSKYEVVEFIEFGGTSYRSITENFSGLSVKTGGNQLSFFLLKNIMEQLKQDHHKVSAAAPEEQAQYKAGRGAQFNTKNRFIKNESTKEHIEGIDDWEETNLKTQYIEQQSKTIVNKIESKDVGMGYSMNPYAGCEHGCIYCYARNVHEYWGYSAGLDFEQKILIKKNAPQLLRKFLQHPKWECAPIMLSGNTDCYQPAEQHYRLTRGLLEVCNEFNQPVGILTKNSWILKDKDVLQDMAKKNIVSAMVSITSFNEDLRRIMEPRTTTAKQKLRVIEELSKAGVRMGIMMGPMIPGLNEHEMQRIMQAAADHGATFTAYTFIRLNGAIKFLFHDWLYKNFPNHADKVWHLIEQSHDGKVNDTRWGVRMRGEGGIADMVAQTYRKFGKLYNMNAEEWSLDTSQFKRPGAQGMLF